MVRPPAWRIDAQSTEPRVRGLFIMELLHLTLMANRRGGKIDL